MEKKLGLVLIAIYGVWFFSVKTTPILTHLTNELQQEEIVDYTSQQSYKTKLTQKQVHDTIVKVAQKEGWLTTEFKSNALIAEKITQNDPIAVTVTFNTSLFSISPNNSNLEDALKKAFFP